MRYFILVVLNMPIILLALISAVTQYKLRRVSKNRFRHQIIIWSIIFALLIASFPTYNTLVGRPPLDSTELSVFDILQTTGLILLFYIANRQRQRLDQHEKRLHELHRELSIKLSLAHEKNH